MARCLPRLHSGIAWPALAFLASPAPLFGQLVGGQWETLHRIDGNSSLEALGTSVAGAGDVDGDGIPDLIVGAPGLNAGFSTPGAAYVHSGRTGQRLHSYFGSAGDRLGESVAGVGDVDGDGFADFAIGAYLADPAGLQNAGSVFLHSGISGALIHRIDGGFVDGWFGFTVAAAGDVDADGVPDLLVAEAGTGGVYVYSAATGVTLHQFNAGPSALLFTAAGAGDIDGDGYADIIAGAKYADPNGLPNAGSAFVYSGANGNLLHQFNGGAASERFGSSVDGAGDLDGDGVPDLIVGAEHAQALNSTMSGSAFAYSGASGSLLNRWDGEGNGDDFGISVAGVGDADGDGWPDVVVGALGADPFGRNQAGAAYLYSGRSGALLHRFPGEFPYISLGASVAGVGDVDGDGLDDFIAGASTASWSWQDSGSAYVRSLAPFLHSNAGQLSASGGMSVLFGMDFPTSEAGARYALFASMTGTGPIVIAGLEIPLTLDNVFHAISSGNIPPILQGAVGTLNANGQALTTLSAGPALAPAVGQTIYFAAVTYDVGPLTGRLSSVVRYLQILP